MYAVYDTVKRYCVYSHRRLYILANRGGVTHSAFTSFLMPRAGANGLNGHAGIIYSVT